MIFVRVFTFLALLAISRAVSEAAIVNLDLQVNQTAKTFSVFATINDSTFDGLASFQIDLLGSGGASLTSAALPTSLRGFNATLGESTGFTQFRFTGTASGSNITGFRASQDTVGSLANDLVIRNFGIGTPVQIATGSYTGTVGTLTAQLSPGFFFNLLPDNWSGPGGTVAATAVNSSSFTLTAIPEPSTVACAGLLVVGLFWKNRRRVTRQLD
jgi:hypothetical protein